MLSPIHPRCDPGSDELSPNGPSLQDACVGQYVWNQLYKGGRCLPLPSVSSPAVLSCWDKESREQLQGQLCLQGTQPFCSVLAGATLPPVPRPRRRPRGSGLSCPFVRTGCRRGRTCWGEALLLERWLSGVDAEQVWPLEKGLFRGSSTGWLTYVVFYRELSPAWPAL